MDMPSSLRGEMTLLGGPSLLLLPAARVRLDFLSMKDSNLLSSPTPAKKFSESSPKKALPSKELRSELAGDSRMLLNDMVL